MTAYAYDLSLNENEGHTLREVLKHTINTCKEKRKVSPNGGPHVQMLNDSKRISWKLVCICRVPAVSTSKATLSYVPDFFCAIVRYVYSPPAWLINTAPVPEQLR